MSEPDEVIVGGAVKDMPTPPVPSAQFPCKDCGEQVWVSKRNSKFGQVPVSCVDCALKRWEALEGETEVEFHITPGTRQELRELFLNERN